MMTREEVVAFGSGGSLIGIVTHPDRFDVGYPAILLLPANGWPRTGHSRLLVTMGRRFAGLGFLCLRFDYSGVGESAPRRDEVPKDRSDILETIEAMDFLETTFGVPKFVAVGFCRGARTCFATAAQDLRISGLALIQIDILVASRQESAIWTEQGSRAVFQSLGRRSSWMRLLRGQADYRARLATIFARVKLKVGGDGRQNESNQVASALASLSGRGVRIRFLFSPGHAGHQYLQTVLKSQTQFHQPLPGMRIETLSQPGHDFHTQAGQRALFQATGDFVTECAIPSSPRARTNSE